MSNIREYRFKQVTSDDGRFSGKIDSEKNEVLTAYCKIMNLNKTKYLNECVLRCIKQDLHKNASAIIDTEFRDELATLIMFFLDGVES